MVFAVIGIVSMSSCYVGVEGGGHRHRHVATRIEIHADNTIPADSLKTPAMSSVNPNDSMQSPSTTGAAK